MSANCRYRFLRATFGFLRPCPILGILCPPDRPLPDMPTVRISGSHCDINTCSYFKSIPLRALSLLHVFAPEAKMKADTHIRIIPSTFLSLLLLLSLPPFF